MAKRVALSTKPQTTRPATLDDWVGAAPFPETPSKQEVAREDGQGATSEGSMKRLTIDVPAGLHTRIKSQCALRGVKMADEIRAMLEEKYPEAS